MKNRIAPPILKIKIFIKFNFHFLYNKIIKIANIEDNKIEAINPSKGRIINLYLIL